MERQMRVEPSHIGDGDWDLHLNSEFVSPRAIVFRDEQIARRLAACWNACQGIDTAVLEDGLILAMARKWLKANPLPTAPPA